MPEMIDPVGQVSEVPVLLAFDGVSFWGILDDHDQST